LNYHSRKKLPHPELLTDTGELQCLRSRVLAALDWLLAFASKPAPSLSTDLSEIGIKGIENRVPADSIRVGQ
jgi:hypothetical protein